MAWLPSWLGKAYCTIRSRFRRTFTVDDVANALNITKAKASLVTSRLARAGWLERIEKGLYRAVEPGEVVERIAMLQEIRANLSKVPQPEFVPPLMRFMELVMRKYGRRLVSAALFGSVARGSATSTSDLDVLLVIRGLPSGIGERYDEITGLVLTTYSGRSPLEPPAPISPVLYTPEEALGFHSIYLDMTRYSVVLWDQGGILRKKIAELSKEMERLGSRRLEVQNKPVWILKPDLKRGEVVELG